MEKKFTNFSILQVPTTQLANMRVDPKLVELAADVLEKKNKTKKKNSRHLDKKYHGVDIHQRISQNEYFPNIVCYRDVTEGRYFEHRCRSKRHGCG